MTCTSCHGTPPGGTHPAGSTLATCGNCHGNYSNATQSIIDPAGHVNGAIDLSNMSCTSCHGTAGRVERRRGGRQPGDRPSGRRLGHRQSRGVHLAHVNQGATAPALLERDGLRELPRPPLEQRALRRDHRRDLRRPVDCPGRRADAVQRRRRTPARTPTATATSRAATRARRPSPGPPRASSAAPSCHGAPPAIATHHPANTACGSCHTGTTATTVTAATHVDGTMQKPANGCTACHGVLSGQAGAAVANTSATAAPGFSATRGRRIR